MAQLDWAVKSIDKPTDLYTNADGTTNLVAQVTLENRGETIPAGDTFSITLAIARQSDGATLLTSPTYSLLNPSEAVNGSTIQTSDISLQINGGVTGTDNLPVYLVAISYHRNRSNPKVDVDSLNNVLLKEMNWKPASRASAASLTYNNNIAAYPNPANTELTVSLNYVQLASTTIELINLNGQVVVSQNDSELFSAKNTLDVSNLEKGIYILKVTNGDATYTRKVSIVH